jgi:hypothetical protein
MSNVEVKKEISTAIKLINWYLNKPTITEKQLADTLEQLKTLLHSLDE